MKLTVIDSNLSGNFEDDLKAGRIRAFSKDGSYVAPGEAVTLIMDGKDSVDGVSNNTPDMTQHGATARSVFDSIKRMRGIATVDAADATPEPKKLSAYDSHKEAIANAWKDAGGAARQRYGDPEEFEQQAKQRETNEKASKSALEKHKEEISNAWRTG